MNAEDRPILFDLLKKAYLAGFKSATEGHNFEYPFEEDVANLDVYWQRDCNEAVHNILMEVGI